MLLKIIALGMRNEKFKCLLVIDCKKGLDYTSEITFYSESEILVSMKSEKEFVVDILKSLRLVTSMVVTAAGHG